MKSEKLNREKIFWSKVDIKEPHECWNYKGGKSANGYGRFWFEGKQLLAHKFAFECAYVDKIKRIPDSLCVLHICDNPSCCNPMHLYLGTYQDNAQDRLKRGRYMRGKLHAGEIWLIRRLKIPIEGGVYKRYKFSSEYVAKMFKVSANTILSIWNSRRHICREGYYV